MLYDLVKTTKGKEEVVMTDALSKVNGRMKVLRDSQRGKRILYEVRPSDETTVKYRKPPVMAFDPSGDAPKVKIRRQKNKRIKNKAKEEKQ